MKKISIFLLGFLTLLAACSDEATNEQVEAFDIATKDMDVHSFSKPRAAVTTHLNLSLTADFEQQTLDGFAKWTIQNNDAEQIIFDTKNLIIQKVTLGEDEVETTYELGEPVQYLGQPLTVDISPETEIVTIYYKTQPEAAALQWLTPQQTAGKEDPFLFTQGQAILTRTWIPCQDSPGIRITYEATIKTPEDLMAVMSAFNPQERNDEGVYNFVMEQPIPPYLMALAIGDLAFELIGERTGVYAEPSVVEDAAYEFAEMEEMLEAAENLYGEYLWDRYDLIVLPPSFPFGGMENPRLTFATPTIIAGDRSLTALVAHELAHSWSGNLVTNATWNDFWLNEGFTVYFEGRIMEEVYGKEYADMLRLLGQQDLEAEVKDLGEESKDTHLKLDLEGRDPDEGMTSIAYEKGAAFLRMLEEKAGRETFDAFLKQYFDEHQFQTITTEQFVHYLNENLIEPQNLDVNVEEWIYGPGIPDNMPVIVSDRFEKVDEQAAAFQKGAAPEDLDTEAWTTHEWLHFIRKLPNDLPTSRMETLDQAFAFSDSGNSEILAAWYELAIRQGYAEQILPKIESFLVEVGRRKFLTPLYRAFKETGRLETARDIYAKARPNYHTVSTQTMDELLEVQG